MRKLKICFIVGSFPSVSETFVLDQVTGLLDMGHDLLIYAGAKSCDTAVHDEVLSRGLLVRTRFYNDKPSSRLMRLFKFLWLLPRALGVAPAVVLSSLNVLRFGREALSLNLFFQAQAFLEARDFDIVVAHFGQNGLVGVRMKDVGALEGKLLTIFHAADLTAFVAREGRGVYQRLFERADLAMAISRYGREKLLEFGCPEKKILVHHMGVDTKRFAMSAGRFSVKSGCGLLSVSRLVEKKGIVDALNAVALLVRDGMACRYMIAGDGPLRPDLEARVRVLGISGHVHFLGSRTTDQVRQLMSDADIFLAPGIKAANADEEGIPVTLMEAMASGLPVVTTLTGGVGELIEDGRTGFVVPVKDAQALAEKVRFILASPDKAAEVADNARRWILEQYEVGTLNRAFESILNGMVFSPNKERNSPWP